MHTNDPRSILQGLRIPVIGAPMFLVSGPELVIEQCKAGILGSFPALNARPQELLDTWLTQIEDALGKHRREHPDAIVAPYGVNLIVNPANKRLEQDTESCIRHKVPVIITSLSAPTDIVKRVHEYGGVVLHDVVARAPRRESARSRRRRHHPRVRGRGRPRGAAEPVRAGERDPAACSTGRSCSPARSRTARACSRRRRWAATPPTWARASSRRRNRSRSSAYKQMLVESNAEDIVYTPFFSGVHGSYLKPSIRAAGLDPDNLPGRERRQAQVPLARRAAEDVEGHLGRGPGRGQHRVGACRPARSSSASSQEYDAARAKLGFRVIVIPAQAAQDASTNTALVLEYPPRAGNDVPLTMTETFAEALEARTQDVLDLCTRCGKCFEVCPMTAPAGIADRKRRRRRRRRAATSSRAARARGRGRALGAGVLGQRQLHPRVPRGASTRASCSRSRASRCRSARAPRSSTRKAAPRSRKMGRGVRVLSRMQLPPEVLKRFRSESREGRAARSRLLYRLQRAQDAAHRAALPRHPRCARRVVPGDGRPRRLLRRAPVSHRRSRCLGPHRLPHDRSLRRDRRVQGAGVVPDVHDPARRERAAGTQGGAGPPTTSKRSSSSSRASSSDLKPLMRHRVEKRVGLHEHPGVAGVCESAIAILRAIPGVEYVELEQPQVGYMCNSSSRCPRSSATCTATSSKPPSGAGVDALAGVYHACHRELCSHEARLAFRGREFPRADRRKHGHPARGRVQAAEEDAGRRRDPRRRDGPRRRRTASGSRKCAR